MTGKKGIRKQAFYVLSGVMARYLLNWTFGLGMGFVLCDMEAGGLRYSTVASRF